MPVDLILWAVAIEVIGYCVWLGYAINRFCPRDDPMFEGLVIIHVVLALVWPVYLAVYVPLRVFRWAGVRVRFEPST